MTTPAALRCGDVVRIRGERWRIVRHVTHDGAAVVDAAGCGATNRASRATFLLPCEPIDLLPASSTPRLVTPAEWRHVARRALAEAWPSWTSLRAAARAAFDIIPFQLEPALALVRGDGCRFLIADAVGLGKTIQAGLMIAEMLARRPDARALVVAPAGLRDQWCDELGRRFGLDPVVLDAPGVAQLSAGLPPEVNPWTVRQVAITSIDYVKRPETMRGLETLTWDVVVFDEAHNLTGRSDRAAAAALLADRARVLVLLTATPHSGDETAFARLCGLGNPDGEEPLVVFRRTRADAATGGSRRAPILRIRPTPAEAAMHAALMRYARLVWTEGAGGARLVASVLARRACSSAASLARSVERRLALLTDSGAADHPQPALPYGDEDDAEPDTLLGLPGLRNAADERRRLEVLLRLARDAAERESKLAALERVLERANEPAIVFTEYRDTLRQIARALGVEGLVELHGGLTRRERADALRRFTTGGARVLLATDAGSEGLNLHHGCRLLINLELPWTPLRLEQRAGRVDRIGQHRRVHIVHLVAADTCEEVTLGRLVRRLHLSRATLSPFETLPDERAVVEAALSIRPITADARRASAMPHGTITLDLGADAAAEAAWIRQARALGANDGHTDMPNRPVIAVVRRRARRTVPSRGVWLFRLGFVDGAGHHVGHLPLALACTLAGPERRADSKLRTALDPRHPAVQDLLRRAGDERLLALQLSCRGAIRRWHRREHALIASLRAHHARLSAVLVQRGLFDGRLDRLADAQAARLSEALSRSHERMADLDACDRLRLEGHDLLFAVVLE
ncbi:MAG: DEAD/DEAH box helicase [Acidobacteria bacterium]|nr:DEAD/DEAH box helicase [Acidobacteriota bacterium]